MKTIVLILLLLPAVAFGQGYFDGYKEGYGSGSAEYTTSTVMFTTDIDRDHATAAFDALVVSADELIELGTVATEFAWCTIDSFNATTSKYVAEPSQNHQHLLQRSGFGGWDTNTAIVGSEAATVDLLYIDWTSYIPAGSTILEAKIHIVPTEDWYRSNTDTTVAVLMTGSSDNLWYTSKGVDDGFDAAPNYAHASWRHQILGLNADGYPQNNAGAWVPELKSRQEYWDWGDRYDWTGFKSSTVQPFFDQTSPATLDLAVDIRNCVQAVLNGETNNGIMIYGADSGPAFVTTRSYFWEPRAGHSAWEFIPWIEVVYSTKPYKAPYPGGHDAAFIFTTDDGRRDFNHTARDSFVKYGGAMTAFVAERFTNDESNTETMDQAELIAFYQGGGVEIGSHSRWHDETHGLSWDARTVAIDKYTDGCDPAVAFVGGTTGRDSVYADTDPIWLYDIATSQGISGGYENDPYFGKSIAAPLHKWTREVFGAVAYHGYGAFRVGEVSTPGNFFNSYSGDPAYDGRALHVTGEYDRWVRSTTYPVIADTARAGIDPFFPLLPYNSLFAPFTRNTTWFVGDETATPTEADVKRNFKWSIAQAIANHSGVVSMYTHDFKSGTYGNGLTADEIGWMLEVCAEMNVWLPRVSEYQNWFRANSIPSATPSGYAYSDTNSFSVESGVWAVPIPETRLFPYEEK
jgi:hypothetical protein